MSLETDSREQRGEPPIEEAAAITHKERLSDDSAPDGFNLFKQPWLAVACLLLVASATLLLLSHPDAAFVCAALGVSAWFWNVRADLKRKHNIGRQK